MITRRREQAKEIRTLLENILRLPVPPEKLMEYGLDQAELRDMTYADAIALRLVDLSCRGETKSIGELLDRLYGKPVQTNENINANMNYYDFLMHMAVEEGMLPGIPDTPDKPPARPAITVVPSQVPTLKPAPVRRSYVDRIFE